jgi:amino acid permease
MYIDYILPFIVGGIFITLEKYISNNISPKLGAILATFPIGLISAYYLIEDDKLPNYLKHYLYQALLNISIGLFVFLLIDEKYLTKKTIFMISALIWTFVSILFFFKL